MFRGILTSTLTLCFLLSPFAEAANRKSGRKRVISADQRLENVIRAYRIKRISPKKTWALIYQIEKNSEKLSRSSKVKIEKMKSILSAKAGYPILASIYAKESIELTKNPTDRDNAYMWRILTSVSKKHSIHFLLEELDRSIKVSDKEPPSFGSDWYYIRANSLMARQKTDAAYKAYSKVLMKDRYFIPAQYQMALIQYRNGDLAGAEKKLLSLLNNAVLSTSPISVKEKRKTIDHTYMALARINYEQKKFFRSASYYRKISKQSPLFYDSLFEQSWALFMGGSLKHALGSLYGVHSPYFENRFNPESKILESMIYFWMCRYDDSRNALADFTEHHRGSVQGLSRFLDRARLDPETTYNIFENLITGVSSESLGVDLSVLQTAAEKDAMIEIRDQYASLIWEIDRLETKGVFGWKKGTDNDLKALRSYSELFRRKIGETFLAELKVLEKQYEEFYDQAQFLYLELLMSEKEQLLGRELHASNKVRQTLKKEDLFGWSINTQSWEDDKREFWWDEIGYQIVDVDPVCLD